MKPILTEDEEEPGFFQKHKLMLIVGALALGAGGWFFMGSKPSKSAPKKKMDMVMIMPVLPPPPPPPPPPPKPPEPEPEEKKVEEEVAAEEEPPPDAPADKPSDKPADEPIGTAIAGGDGNGLGLGGGGGGGGGGMIGGGKSYSERGRWQGKFSREIADALRRTPELKKAKANFPIRVWLDDTGRVTRVVLNGSTGDAKQDEALKNRALTGQMFEAPPAGTPMPVKLLFTAR